MKKLKFNERRFALLCAIVLIVMSIGAALRQSDAVNQWSASLFGGASTEVTGKEQPTELEKAAAKALEAPLEVGVSDQEQTVTVKSAPEAAPKVAVAPKEDASSKSETPKTKALNTGESSPKATDGSSYSYTAVAGDSYTGFARQALASQAKVDNLTLTADQQLTAEVSLVNAAGAPLLEVGQAVVIAKADVSAALAALGAAAPVVSDKADVTATDTTTVKGGEAIAVNEGDSYISVARAVIARKVADAKKVMSPAQKIAAETILAQSAGWPMLETGQKLTIDSSKLESAIKTAEALDVASQTAWQSYADQIAW